MQAEDKWQELSGKQGNKSVGVGSNKVPRTSQGIQTEV